jgi:hypothetical protein
MNSRLMTIREHRFGVPGSVPQANRVVIASTRQHHTIRMPGHCAYGAEVGPVGNGLHPTGDVPQTHDTVCTHTRQHRPVGAEAHLFNQPSMAFQDSEGRPAKCRPEPDYSVQTAASKQPAIRAPGECEDSTCMAAQAADLLAAAHLMQHDLRVLPRTRKQRPVRPPSQGAYGLSMSV